MSILADIYYGDYSACKPTTAEEFKLEADKKRLDGRIAQFAKGLNEEVKKEFNLLMNSRNELMSREAYIMFEKGVEFGVSFIEEIYQD